MVRYEDIYHDYSGVVELKYKDFEIKDKKIFIKNKNFLNKGFIVFYAPWCSPCKRMGDDYSELALTYKNIYPIGAVNTEDIKNNNDLLSSIANVKQYPTIKKISKDGLLENFDTEFNKNNILYYINISI
jgi:thiol-disulfide isomerase/thioredoxin